MSDNVSIDTPRFTGNISVQIEQRRNGTRKNVRHGGTLCSGCLSVPPAKGQRYCVECHRIAARASARRKSAELKRLRAEHGGQPPISSPGDGEDDEGGYG
jgi:hypothetical protein